MLFIGLLVRGLLQCVAKTEYTCKLGMEIIKEKWVTYLFMHVCILTIMQRHDETQVLTTQSDWLVNASLEVFQRRGTQPLALHGKDGWAAPYSGVAGGRMVINSGAPAA